MNKDIICWSVSVLPFAVSVIETVGVEKAIKLYKTTEDVEQMGGLMIQVRM